MQFQPYAMHLLNLNPAGQASHYLNPIHQNITPFAFPRPLPTNLNGTRDSFIGQYGAHLSNLTSERQAGSYFPVYPGMNNGIPPIIPPQFMPARIEGSLQHQQFTPPELSLRNSPLQQQVPEIKVAATLSTEERIQKLEQSIKELRNISSQHRFQFNNKRRLNSVSEDVDKAKVAQGNLQEHFLHYAERDVNKLEKSLSNKKKSDETSAKK